jgi:hypothetical protein
LFTGKSGNIELCYFLLVYCSENRRSQQELLGLSPNATIRETVRRKAIDDMNLCLRGACERRHCTLASWLIDRGATQFEYCSEMLPREDQFMVFSALTTDDKRRAMARKVRGLGQYATDMAVTRALLEKKLPLPGVVMGGKIWGSFLGYCSPT